MIVPSSVSSVMVPSEIPVTVPSNSISSSPLYSSPLSSSPFPSWAKATLPNVSWEFVISWPRSGRAEG